MTLIVQTASFAQLERTYILTILLSEFLGLSWQHQVSNARGDTQVRLSGYEGEIFISDFFFNQMESHWLHSQSLPTLPLLMWDTRLLSPSIPLVDPMVPIIYGNTNLTSIINGSTIRLPVDIFGSAFFMLTRYEEAVISHRDNHDRFPATASLAYQAGFLHRPIIDEYVEILWAAIHQLWPGLQRRSRQPRTLVSCDVDNPYEAYTKSWKKMTQTSGRYPQAEKRVYGYANSGQSSAHS